MASKIEMLGEVGKNTYEITKTHFILDPGRLYFFGRKNPNGTIGGSKGVILKTIEIRGLSEWGNDINMGYMYVIRTEKPILDVDKIMQIADPYDKDGDGKHYRSIYKKLKKNKNV